MGEKVGFVISELGERFGVAEVETGDFLNDGGTLLRGSGGDTRTGSGNKESVFFRRGNLKNVAAEDEAFRPVAAKIEWAGLLEDVVDDR